MRNGERGSNDAARHRTRTPRPHHRGLLWALRRRLAPRVAHAGLGACQRRHGLRRATRRMQSLGAAKRSVLTRAPALVFGAARAIRPRSMRDRQLARSAGMRYQKRAPERDQRSRADSTGSARRRLARTVRSVECLRALHKDRNDGKIWTASTRGLLSGRR